MNAIWAACSDACAPTLTACGEVDLQHLAEREREADERAERADVEQRDHPGVALPQDHAHGRQVDPVLLQVVHVERGADPGDRQRDQVDRAHPIGLPVADGGDDEQADELDHRHPDVAAACVDAQRPALEPLRVERVDVGHRRREIATAEAGQRRAHQIRPQRQAGVCQQPHRPDSRDQQHERREHGPVAAAERRGGQRVRDPQAGADQRRDGAQQELVARREAVDRLGHEQHHHRPDRPDREADMLRRDRPDQVAAGDVLVAGLPGDDVLGIPVGDAMRHADNARNALLPESAPR